MGERKNIKRVKKLVRKLHQAIDKGQKHRLQKQFESREEALRHKDRVTEIAKAMEAAKSPDADVRQPKSFRDAPAPDQLEGEGEDEQ